MRKRAWLIIVISILLCPMLIGCREIQEEDSALPAYIVISDELDVGKTTEKVDAILDNTSGQDKAESLD